MKDIKFNANDYLSFADKSEHKCGLRGHVSVYRENLETKEISLWEESDNIIPISGYQFVLMKMFGLHLDSNHAHIYDDIGRDTNLIIPDLNNSGAYQIGTDPNNYSTMLADISEEHCVQGFMIGNGGSGEDAITTKNTDYSFTKLRNPIPFQQTQTSLTNDVSNKYLGMLRVGASSFSKSYYIKKFDERPHIYHSWWRDGQRWDYVDPVTQNDLGPNPVNGVGKTNRIETYVNCKMSLNEDDCISYFTHDGSTQTAIINELGLVAFDTDYGVKTIMEKVYSNMIKDLIKIVYNNQRTLEDSSKLVLMAANIHKVVVQLKSYGQTNINNFITTLEVIMGNTPLTLDYSVLKTELSKVTNIGVEAFYNQNGSYVYETDNFLSLLADDKFSSLTTDEAQRIKLVTYYTFKSIPLQSNWRIHINYRIYAN